MSFRRRNSLGSRSASVNRQQQSQMNGNNRTTDSAMKHESLPNILPEFMQIVRKLLPQEFPLDMHVRNVEYIESGCERLSGTLYMTTFRLVFAPDNEIGNNILISSSNKYIGEYDIPLTSIYKINVAPVDSRAGFKSFLNENQIQSETRTFTIITRDFRNITFTKCSVTKSHTVNAKQPQQISVTKMETYIDALRSHSRFQDKEQLYLYLALKQNTINNSSSRVNRSHTISTMFSSNVRSIDDDPADFSMSNDERMKSYMTYSDWKDELYEANDEQWIVDRNKFDDQSIVQDEGPYVCLASSHDYDAPGDLIWHWTHTSLVENDPYYQQNRREVQAQKYILVTVPGIGEITTVGDPVESPGGLLVVPSSPFHFAKLGKILPKSFRSHINNGPKLICTNEIKTTTSGLTAMTQVPPEVG